MMANPYQQYQSTQVQTASKGDLIVLLYDGAIRFLSRARLALTESRLESATADLQRGQEIVLELLAGLDYERGGDLAVNLRDLYLFMHKPLLQASVKKDAEAVTTVIGLLDEIRGAWRQALRAQPGVTSGADLPMTVGAKAA